LNTELGLEVFLLYWSNMG